MLYFRVVRRYNPVSCGVQGGVTMSCSAAVVPCFCCCYYPCWQGEWASGKPHGQGTATHKDGEKYVGTYKAGLYHGEGEELLYSCEVQP